ncbi:hypothetical protein HanPSC8_Chr03g0121621 [Helianthus annuus]|nr:hypothetical protein HanPSC8_Chr03g0121621 [Helianthus annuus]
MHWFLFNPARLFASTRSYFTAENLLLFESVLESSKSSLKAHKTCCFA